MTLASRNGKWTVSDNEEVWTCGEDFDTKEDAIAYALGDFADEYNVEPGHHVWVGQIVEIGADDLANAAVCAETAIENIDEMLYEYVSDEVQNELEVTKEQQDDLDGRLHAAVKQWLTDHGLKAPCWRIGASTSFVVEEREDEP